MDCVLIARFLAGECSESEVAKIDRWINETYANRMMMEEYKYIWELSGHCPTTFVQIFNAEKDWKSLRQSIEAEEVINGMQNGFEFPQKQPMASRRNSNLAQMMRVAAGLLLAGLVGVFAYTSLYNPIAEEAIKPTLREIATRKGQQANITLSDGTKVQLNADSKILLHNSFQADRREVYLVGEAFFEVAENPERPFLIHVNNGALVRILGTSLGIRSYAEEKEARVVVKEGKVSLQSAKEANHIVKAVLSPKEVGVIKFSRGDISTQKVKDMELYLGWTEGYLKFRDAPMIEVVEALERKYDLEIHLENKAIEKLRLTAVLKSRSIRNVLDVISGSLGIEYELNQQEVIFRK